LINAEAVIAHAGFELASEALCLGKKLLVKPLDGQFEQQANAKALLELRLGGVLKRLDSVILRVLLQTAPPPPCRFPRYVDDLVRWIETKDWRNIKGLSKAAWDGTNAIDPSAGLKRPAAP
jgi:hypothetical protein